MLASWFFEGSTVRRSIVKAANLRPRRPRIGRSNYNWSLIMRKPLPTLAFLTTAGCAADDPMIGSWDCTSSTSYFMVFGPEQIERTELYEIRE